MGLLLLAALGLAVASSFFLYRKGPWFLLALRGLVLAMLVGLILNPAIIPAPTAEPRVVFILDLSPSMEGVMAWERKMVEKTRSLPGKKEYLGVSDRVVPEPETLRVIPSDYTDLSLGFARDANVYVLLSDGLHNAGSEVSPTAPVVAFIPPKEPETGLTVQGLDLPRTIRVGQETPCVVHYAVRGSWRGRCIASMAGKTVLDTPLSLEEGEGLLRFGFVPGTKGPARLRIGFVPETPGDDPGDNSWQRSFLVEEEGFTVKIVAGRPWPDLGALRRVMEGLPGVSLRSFVRVGGEWRELVGDTVKPARPPGFKASATVLLAGSQRELSPYMGQGPALVFMFGDPWGVPGASGYQGEGFYLRSPPGSRIPDSLLEDLPPVTRFWRVPASQARKIILSAGPWPLVFSRKKITYVASSYLWAQNTASGGELYRLVISEFLERAMAGNLRLSVWASEGFKGGPVFVNAQARLPDGSEPEGLWPRINGKPMRKTGPGMFQAGPLRFPPGDTSVRVDFYREGRVVAARELPVSVSPYPAEDYDYGVDTPFVRSLAENSGGRVISSAEELREILEGMRRPSGPRRPMDVPWLVFFPVLGLILEWAVRRWRGMA